MHAHAHGRVSRTHLEGRALPSRAVVSTASGVDRGPCSACFLCSVLSPLSFGLSSLAGHQPSPAHTRCLIGDRWSMDAVQGAV